MRGREGSPSMGGMGCMDWEEILHSASNLKSASQSTCVFSGKSERL